MVDGRNSGQLRVMQGKNMTKKQKLQIKSRVIGILVLIVGCLTYPLGLAAAPVILSIYMGTSVRKELNEAAHFDVFVRQNKMLVSICVVLMLSMSTTLLALALIASTKYSIIVYMLPLAAFLPVVVLSEAEMFKKNGQLT